MGTGGDKLPLLFKVPTCLPRAHTQVRPYAAINDVTLGIGGTATRARVSTHGAHAGVFRPLLLSACCSLPSAYCRLPSAYCRLSAKGSVTLNVEPSPGWLFTDTRPP